jgi:hypothetical protein
MQHSGDQPGLTYTPLSRLRLGVHARPIPKPLADTNAQWAAIQLHGQKHSEVGRIILGFGLAAALGAVMGLIAGHYFVPAVPAYPLSFWLEHPIRYGHWQWALGGATTGIAIRYLMVSD